MSEDVGMKQLFAKDKMNIEIWEDIKETVKTPRRKLHTISWDMGLLEFLYEIIPFNLSPSWQLRPPKLLFFESEDPSPHEYNSLAPLFHHFEVLDFSNPQVADFIDKWKSCLDSVFLYMAAIKEDLLAAVLHQKLSSAFGIPPSAPPTTGDLHFPFTLKPQFAHALPAHSFALTHHLFNHTPAALDPFAAQIHTYYVHRAKNQWDLQLTKCTNAKPTPQEVASYSKMEGVCVVALPVFPLWIHVSGGDGDWMFGVLEEKELEKGNGYLVRPSNGRFEGLEEGVVRHSWRFGESYDGNYCIDLKEDCLYLKSSHSPRVVIYSNIPKGSYYFYLSMNKGPTTVKLLG